MYTFEPDIYSTRLLSKISKLNSQAKVENRATVDVELVKTAIWYSKMYYDKKTRYDGELSYIHPIVVADMVSDFRFNTNTVVTAILHRMIEDLMSEIDKHRLWVWFGPTIAENVEALSRNRPDYVLEYPELINDMYSRNMIDALHVKIADRWRELRVIGEKSVDKQRSVARETIEYFMVASSRLGISEITNVLLQECRHILMSYQFIPDNFYYEHNILSTSFPK